MKHYPKEVIARAKKLIPIIQAIANDEPTEFREHGEWLSNCNEDALYHIERNEHRVTQQRTYIEKMGVKEGDMIINKYKGTFDVIFVEEHYIIGRLGINRNYTNKELEEMQAKKIQIIEPE